MAFSQTTSAAAPQRPPWPPNSRPIWTVRKITAVMAPSWAAAPSSGLARMAADTMSTPSGEARSAR